jgi:hypothetical protein
MRGTPAGRWRPAQCRWTRRAFTDRDRFMLWHDMGSISMDYVWTDLLQKMVVKPRRTKGVKTGRRQRLEILVSGKANGIFLSHVVAYAAKRHAVKVRNYRRLPEGI